jgi:hypothetical protein
LGIERIAKKRGACGVEYNLALDRANDDKLPFEDRQRILNYVLDDAAKNGDYYSEARAIIDKVRLLMKQELPVSDKDRTRLISAYHFLFRERYEGTFDACHAVLWKLFERANDVSNLFSLFRHSSLTWRLRGDVARETRYRLRISKYAEASMIVSIHLLSKELAYYVIRVGSVGGNDPQVSSGLASAS